MSVRSLDKSKRKSCTPSDRVVLKQFSATSVFGGQLHAKAPFFNKPSVGNGKFPGISPDIWFSATEGHETFLCVNVGVMSKETSRETSRWYVVALRNQPRSCSRRHRRTKPSALPWNLDFWIFSTVNFHNYEVIYPVATTADLVRQSWLNLDAVAKEAAISDRHEND